MVRIKSGMRRRRHKRSSRKQASPALMVDWNTVIRRHANGAPVFRGVDRQISMKMHQEAQRHARGRWAGSRYSKRNETGGHVLVPAMTRVVRGEVRHITWSISNDPTNFNPSKESDQ